MRTSETIEKVAPSFVKAQERLENPPRTAKAVYGDYAPLNEILAAVRPILAHHGLSLLQEDVTVDGNVGVVTVILHESGEWLELGPFYVPGGANAQQHGGAATYARRYALCAALGIAADEDDDGQNASRTEAARAPRRKGRGAETSGTGPDEAPEESSRQRSRHGEGRGDSKGSSGATHKAGCANPGMTDLKPDNSPMPRGYLRCSGCGVTFKEADVA